MAVNRYSRQIAPAQMRQMSFEDIARVPMAYRQMELASRDTLSGLDLNVPAYQGDKPAVKAITAPIEARIDQLSTEIAKEGITQARVNEVLDLQSEVKKLMSPTGKLGIIKGRTETLKAWEDELRKTKKWSQQDINTFINQELKGYKTFEDEDFTTTSAWSPSYLPNFIDTSRQFNSYLTGLKAETALLQGAPAEMVGMELSSAMNDPQYAKFIDSDRVFQLLLARGLSDPELVRFAQVQERLNHETPEPFFKEVTTTDENGKQVIKEVPNLANMVVAQMKATANIRAYQDMAGGRSGSGSEGGTAYLPSSLAGADRDLANQNFTTRVIDIYLDEQNKATTRYSEASDLTESALADGNNIHGIHEYILGDNFNTAFQKGALKDFEDTEVFNKNIQIGDSAFNSEDYFNAYEQAIKQLPEGDIKESDINNFVDKLSPFIAPENQKGFARHVSTLLQSADANAIQNLLITELDTIENYKEAKLGYIQSVNDNMSYFEEQDKLLKSQGSSIEEKLALPTTGPGTVVGETIYDRQTGQQRRPDAQVRDIANKKENMRILTIYGSDAFKQRLINEIEKSDLQGEAKEIALSQVDSVVNVSTSKLADFIINSNKDMAIELVESRTAFNIDESSLTPEKYQAYESSLKTALAGVAANPANTFLYKAVDTDGNPLTIQKIWDKADSWASPSHPNKNKSLSELVASGDVELDIIPTYGGNKIALTVAGLNTPLIIDDSRSTAGQTAINRLLNTDWNNQGSSFYYSIPDNTSSGRSVLKNIYLQNNKDANRAYNRMYLAQSNEKDFRDSIPIGNGTAEIIYNAATNKVNIRYLDSNGAQLGKPVIYANAESAFQDLGVKYRQALISVARQR